MNFQKILKFNIPTKYQKTYLKIMSKVTMSIEIKLTKFNR